MGRRSLESGAPIGFASASAFRLPVSFAASLAILAFTRALGSNGEGLTEAVHGAGNGSWRGGIRNEG